MSYREVSLLLVENILEINPNGSFYQHWNYISTIQVLLIKANHRFRMWLCLWQLLSSYFAIFSKIAVHFQSTKRCICPTPGYILQTVEWYYKLLNNCNQVKDLRRSGSALLSGTAELVLHQQSLDEQEAVILNNFYI